MSEPWERPCENKKVRIWVHGERGAHKREHFHIRGVDWKVSLDLNTFEVLATTGSVDRSDFDVALGVARDNVDALRKRWRERNAVD